jgi:hypothetical protein
LLRTSTIFPTIRLIRTFVVMVALVGCGGDKIPAADAVIQIDAPVVTLDCPTYCTEIQSNCIGANAQYPDMAHCLATCSSFFVGSSTIIDMSGNTLGCRIYYVGAPSKMAPGTHCVHAGPGGDLITATAPAFCSGGDICASFCALEIKACGSLDVPLPGNPRDDTNNPLFQYQNIDNSVSSCATFNKTHAYATTATGDSLACRLYHATNAAFAIPPNGAMHCSHTAANPTAPCAGAAAP